MNPTGKHEPGTPGQEGRAEEDLITGATSGAGDLSPEERIFPGDSGSGRDLATGDPGADAGTGERTGAGAGKTDIAGAAKTADATGTGAGTADAADVAGTGAVTAYVAGTADGAGVVGTADAAGSAETSGSAGAAESSDPCSVIPDPAAVGYASGSSVVPSSLPVPAEASSLSDSCSSPLSPSSPSTPETVSPNPGDEGGGEILEEAERSGADTAGSADPGSSALVPAGGEPGELSGQVPAAVPAARASGVPLEDAGGTGSGTGSPSPSAGGTPGVPQEAPVTESVRIQAAAVRRRLGRQSLLFGCGLLLLFCGFLLTVHAVTSVVTHLFDALSGALNMLISAVSAMLEGNVLEQDYSALWEESTGAFLRSLGAGKAAFLLFRLGIAAPGLILGSLSLLAVWEAVRAQEVFREAREAGYEGICRRAVICGGINALACFMGAFLVLLSFWPLLLHYLALHLAFFLSVWLLIRYFTIRSAMGMLSRGRHPGEPSLTGTVVILVLAALLFLVPDLILLPLLATVFPF